VGPPLHKEAFPDLTVLKANSYQVRFTPKVVGRRPNGPRSQAPVAGNAYPEAPPPQRPGKPSKIKDSLTVAYLDAPNLSRQSLGTRFL
jgi:hypothetical protein